eukprot:CAMPEP_0117420284 /NCGR_PEP_ID=MMETSP0758-20121206/1650_1 /TAXON_ID=63605 /ORGANISM="Percolomonas cosmopolitus, Strain AE-1 (ATCC 50343)" /LENGTH=77 /DNA_ID=CAMNT_0005201803 /DNA_START=3923 /DNA_END=4156 /DNA_ORIENTATION=-
MVQQLQPVPMEQEVVLVLQGIKIQNAIIVPMIIMQVQVLLARHLCDVKTVNVILKDPLFHHVMTLQDNVNVKLVTLA